VSNSIVARQRRLLAHSDYKMKNNWKLAACFCAFVLLSGCANTNTQTTRNVPGTVAGAGVGLTGQSHWSMHQCTTAGGARVCN
jgi:uncharacterized protein YceK